MERAGKFFEIAYYRSDHEYFANLGKNRTLKQIKNIDSWLKFVILGLYVKSDKSKLLKYCFSFVHLRVKS